MAICCGKKNLPSSQKTIRGRAMPRFQPHTHTRIFRFYHRRNHSNALLYTHIDRDPRHARRRGWSTHRTTSNTTDCPSTSSDDRWVLIVPPGVLCGGEATTGDEVLYYTTLHYTTLRYTMLGGGVVKPLVISTCTPHPHLGGDLLGRRCRRTRCERRECEVQCSAVV